MDRISEGISPGLIKSKTSNALEAAACAQSAPSTPLNGHLTKADSGEW